LLLFFISRRPPPARLLPYTTLFRSQPRGFQASIGGFFNTVAAVVTREIPVPKDDEDMEPEMRTVRALVTSPIPGEAEVTKNPQGLLRSEEHTSELQSRENLVCRLLLEKKKQEQKAKSRVLQLHNIEVQ